MNQEELYQNIEYLYSEEEKALEKQNKRRQKLDNTQFYKEVDNLKERMKKSLEIKNSYYDGFKEFY